MPRLGVLAGEPRSQAGLLVEPREEGSPLLLGEAPASAATDVLAAIVDLELTRSLARPGLSRRRLTLSVDPAARARLAELGWHPSYGARPLRRVIEERVFTPLAARIATDPTFADRSVSIVAHGSAAEQALDPSARADAIVV